jgi:hypothetical protein
MTIDTPPFRTSDTARATGMSFRAPVPLAQLLKPVGGMVWVSSSNFLAFLRRIVRAILSRVAKTFNVNLDMASPADGAGHDASFFASKDNPGGQAAVEGAAGEATRELNEFVQSLVGKQPDLERLGSEKGPAYLALVLEELGTGLQAAKVETEDLEASVDEYLPLAAERLGVTPLEARALFEEGDIPEAGEFAKSADVKALLAVFSRLQDVKRDTARMRSSFCTHYAAACAPGSNLAQTAQAKLTKFGGLDLEKMAENSLSQVRPDEKQASAGNSSVNSPRGNKVFPIRLASVNDPAAQSRTPENGFRSRAGRYGGGVDDGLVPPATYDIDDTESAIPSRER